ncbi:MAG: hypothetical protein IIC74_09050 [Bacteroidetes bacterium]|nr:hypothetical protein [Bacteroidota bacterium]
MSRYTSILDGTETTEASLAEGGFDYYLFERPGGSGVIMRIVTGTTTVRFFLFGSGDTQAIWDDRVNKSYVRPSTLKSL